MLLFLENELGKHSPFGAILLTATEGYLFELDCAKRGSRIDIHMHVPQLCRSKDSIYKCSCGFPESDIVNMCGCYKRKCQFQCP